MKRVTTLLVSTAIFLLTAVAAPAVAQASGPAPGLVHHPSCGICWE